MGKASFAVTNISMGIPIVFIFSSMPIRENGNWKSHINGDESARFINGSELDNIINRGYNLETGRKIPFDLRLNRFRYDIEKHYGEQVKSGEETFFRHDLSEQNIRSVQLDKENYSELIKWNPLNDVVYAEGCLDDKLRYTRAQMVAFYELSGQGMYFDFVVDDDYLYHAFGVEPSTVSFLGINRTHLKGANFNLILFNDSIDDGMKFHECAAYTGTEANNRLPLEDYPQVYLPVTKAIKNRLKYIQEVRDGVVTDPYLIYLFKNLTWRDSELDVGSVVLVHNVRWLIGEIIDITTSDDCTEYIINTDGHEKHNAVYKSLKKGGVIVKKLERDNPTEKIYSLFDATGLLYDQYRKDDNEKHSFVEYLEQYL